MPARQHGSELAQTGEQALLIADFTDGLERETPPPGYELE
jgi:hypothetical protein